MRRLDHWRVGPVRAPGELDGRVARGWSRDDHPTGRLAHDVLGDVSHESLQRPAAAAEAGVVDREAAILETLTAIKRAGAQFVLTYLARQAAELLGGR